MQREELLYQGYEYEYKGGRNNSYFFETEKEIFYEIKFTPTDYLFEDELLNQNTFEFSIIVIENKTGKNPTFDVKTSHTIASIFKHFYEKSDEYVTIYICDSYDRRKLVRHRKFTQWFIYFADSNFMKMDAIIKDKTQQQFPLCFIFKETNPCKIEISSAFFKLVEEYNQGK